MTRVHELREKLIGSGTGTSYSEILMGLKIATALRELYEVMVKHKEEEAGHMETRSAESHLGQQPHCIHFERRTDSLTSLLVFNDLTGHIFTSAIHALSNFFVDLMDAVHRYEKQVVNLKIPAHERALVDTYHCFVKICFSIYAIDKAIVAAISSVESFTGWKSRSSFVCLVDTFFRDLWSFGSGLQEHRRYDKSPQDGHGEDR